MGPDEATETMRKALSMGADKAVHVVDDALHGSDAVATSLALAKALEQLGDVDLVMLGSESTDARMSVVPAMLAERLGAPQLTFAKRSRSTTARSIKRLTDDGYKVVEARCPPSSAWSRRSTSRATRRSRGSWPRRRSRWRRSRWPTSASTPATSAWAARGARSSRSRPRPPRQAGTVVKDEGDGGADKLAEFLASKKFI